MNHKIFLLITPLAIAAVFFLLLPGSWDDQQEDVQAKKLFPDFNIEQLNAVKEISAQKSEIRLTLSREGDDWLVANFHNYPANIVKVRKLLRTFLEAEKLAEKTSDPQYYVRLGVEDTTQADAQGRLIVVAGDNFKYELIFGNLSTQISQGQYVRKPAEKSSWLINQKFIEPFEAEEWLDKEIVDLRDSEIMQIEVQRMKTPDIAYSISREHVEQELSFMPSPAVSSTLDLSRITKELKRDIRRLTGLVDYMTFKRVLLLKDLSAAEDGEKGDNKAPKTEDGNTHSRQPVRLTFTTFNGLILYIEAYESMDKELFRISSETSPAADMKAQEKSRKLSQLTQDYIYEMPSSLYSGLFTSNQRIIGKLYP